jgi:hypothetical protein
MLVNKVASDLMRESNTNSNQKYNVVVGGVVKRAGVQRIVAESYIRTLSLNEQSQTSLVAVTNDGKQILFG